MIRMARYEGGDEIVDRQLQEKVMEADTQTIYVYGFSLAH